MREIDKANRKHKAYNEDPERKAEEDKLPVLEGTLDWAVPQVRIIFSTSIAHLLIGSR